MHAQPDSHDRRSLLSSNLVGFRPTRLVDEAGGVWWLLNRPPEPGVGGEGEAPADLGPRREDKPGQDESWVRDGDSSFRAVRGLPLAGSLDSTPAEGAAWREVLCGTAPCRDKLSKTPNFVRLGFRCARAATSEER